MKRRYLLIIFLLLILLVGCTPKEEEKKKEEKENNNKETKEVIKYTDKITASKTECDYKPKLLFEFDNRKVYSYCIDSIKINDKDLNDKNIEDFISELENIDSYNKHPMYDGGTTMYNGTSMNVLVCKKLVDFGLTNQDIYIGSSDMNYKANFCLPNNETITRRFKVDKIDGKNVTISRDNEQGTIYYTYDKTLEVGKSYDFEIFISESLIYDDKIEVIFKIGTLVEVRDAE